MGNSITIAFNHPLDRSQEIVIYPEIKKRPRPSQVESGGVKQSTLGEVQGASSSTQDGSLLQSIGNSSQTSRKQEVDTSTSHGKVQSPKGGKTDTIVDENRPIQESGTASVATSSFTGTKPSNKWWRRLFKKKNIPKETTSSCQEASFLQNSETASLVDASVTSNQCIKKDSAQREEMQKEKKKIALHEKPKTIVNGRNGDLDRPIEDQPGPSGTHRQHYYNGKTSVVKRLNNILQNKEQPSSSKQVSKNFPLPSSRFVTHSLKHKMKLNQNLPSSSRQKSNNFSYNLRELPSSRQRKDDSSRKHPRDSDQKPPLPSNQNRREPPRQVPAPPTRTRKDTSSGQNTTVKNEKPLSLPSQQNTSKYRRGLFKPSSHQAPVPLKRQREDHRSWQNTRKDNQEPPLLPSNQNSRTRGKKPPSHCVRSNVDCDSHRRPPVPQPLNEFNFRSSLWARELEPRIIRVPDSRNCIPGTSLEEKARYNHVKTWILSVQQHFNMKD